MKLIMFGVVIFAAVVTAFGKDYYEGIPKVGNNCANYIDPWPAGINSSHLETSFCYHYLNKTMDTLLFGTAFCFRTSHWDPFKVGSINDCLSYNPDFDVFHRNGTCVSMGFDMKPGVYESKACYWHQENHTGGDSDVLLGLFLFALAFFLMICGFICLPICLICCIVGLFGVILRASRNKPSNNSSSINGSSNQPVMHPHPYQSPNINSPLLHPNFVQSHQPQPQQAQFVNIQPFVVNSKV